MLVAKGRISLGCPTLEWLEQSFTGSRMTLVPIDPTIAALAAALPLHGDPADRLIVATAAARDAMLVTRDQAIQRSGLVRTAW